MSTSTKNPLVSDRQPLVSDAFKVFMAGTPDHARAWMGAVQGLDSACALDEKTGHLAYLAVLAALGLSEGIPFHVALARDAGASREEVASAILVGLPAAGMVAIHALPAALAAFESE